QPCSQPRYGFTERSKPTSGELLRLITVRARSSVTEVAGRGASAMSAYTDSQPSSVPVVTSDWNLPATREAAPRPLIGAWGLRASSMPLALAGAVASQETARDVYWATFRPAPTHASA